MHDTGSANINCLTLKADLQRIYYYPHFTNIELKIREFKRLFQGHTAYECQAGIQTQADHSRALVLNHFLSYFSA